MIASSLLSSIAMIFIFGLAAGWAFGKIKLPGLMGMLITGIVLGPFVLNLLSPDLLNISSQIRQLALIIILTRAGLALDINDLKKVGRPAILMCFVPACFEIAAMMLIAPRLLGISLLDAAIMGAVVGAVSPAVIVPKMLNLMEEGYGTDKSIPQMILAGASVDDVFVIVLFTAFTNLAQGGSLSVLSFLEIPISIVTGILVGLLLGYLLSLFFNKFKSINIIVKVLILLSFSILLMFLETLLKNSVPFSGLLAVMSAGLAIQKKSKASSIELSDKYKKLWIPAEVLLFALVGASVDINYALKAGLSAILLIFAVLAFRMLGVFCCMLFTKLNMKERIFCMIAYIPKATVQAAIGGIPLALGLASGQVILTVAVLAILITAPLGAFGVDITHKRLLTVSKQPAAKKI